MQKRIYYSYDRSKKAGGSRRRRKAVETLLTGVSGPGVHEHPVTAALLRDGELSLFPAAECKRCRAKAEVYRGGECLCRACALETWRYLSERRQLELLGFELM